MSLLSFDLDMLDEEFIYVPPRPRIVWAVAPAPKPAETCCGCGVDHYEHQLCPECGLCLSECCDCPPVMLNPVDELDGDPDYLDFLARADYQYEDWRDER